MSFVSGLGIATAATGVAGAGLTAAVLTRKDSDAAGLSNGYFTPGELAYHISLPLTLSGALLSGIGAAIAGTQGHLTMAGAFTGVAVGLAGTALSTGIAGAYRHVDRGTLIDSVATRLVTRYDRGAQDGAIDIASEGTHRQLYVGNNEASIHEYTIRPLLRDADSRTYGGNGDGRVTASEIGHLIARRFDHNHDGRLSGFERNDYTDTYGEQFVRSYVQTNWDTGLDN